MHEVKFSIIFFFVSVAFLSAQGLNYIYKPDKSLSAVNLRYNEQSSSFDVLINESIEENFEQVLTITDKKNNIVGYTNGKFVWGVNGDTIPNGDSLGWTKSWEMITTQAIHFKTETINSAVILPTSSDSLWLLFYQDFVWKYDVDNFALPYMEECGEAEFAYTSEHLYMAKIRMYKDGHLLIFPNERDIPVVKDFMIHKSLMVVQHANAKDYWILAPCQHNSTAYSVMVSDSTATVIGNFQFSGTNINHIWFGNGTTRFNYLGDKIVRLNYRHYVKSNFSQKPFTQYIELLNFDRCEGKVTNRISLDSFPRPDRYGAKMDAIFSKDDRYLYVSERYSLVRKDLTTQTGILVDQDTIIQYDRNFTGSESASFDDFTVLNYFPDGRIWMHGLGSSPYLHLISNPTAEDIEDVGYINKYITLPEDPKNPSKLLKAKYSHTWDLLPREPIDCTPVNTQNLINQAIFIYPNPVSNKLTIKGISVGTNIMIINLTSGLTVYQGVMAEDDLDVSTIQNGIYAIKTSYSQIKFVKL